MRMLNWVLFLIIFQIIFAAENSNIELFRPAKRSGQDVMQVFYQRRSAGSFSEQKVGEDKLGTLLWMANGVNRDDGRRTAPSAFGSDFINIYVVTDTAIYLYDSKEHALGFVVSGNFREKFAIQDFVKTAPVLLVLTASLNKLPVYAGGRSARLAAAQATSGAIGQNVYLGAATLGLGTRYVMFMNDRAIKHYLKLNKNEVPLAIMPVGYSGN